MEGYELICEIIFRQKDEIERLRVRVDSLEQKLRDANIATGAEWKINPDGWYPYCSNCGTEPRDGYLTNYCPECGSDMRKESER